MNDLRSMMATKFRNDMQKTWDSVQRFDFTSGDPYNKEIIQAMIAALLTDEQMNGFIRGMQL